MDLLSVQPGFFDPTTGSQSVFRAALSAMSHPGRVVSLNALADRPRHGHAASAWLLLALLDADCRVWLSAALAASDVPAWLRFHTGCQIVEQPGQADFVWTARGDAMPRLCDLRTGSDAYPEQSSTCVIEVQALSERSLGPADVENAVHGLLKGPGINGVQALCCVGLPSDFERQWAENRVGFPRGVDVFLTCGPELLGLPRSTQIGAAGTL